MHSIYLYIKKEQLENLFINSYKYSEDLLNKEINYQINKRDYHKEIFNIICKKCDDNNFCIALPHHYVIMECFTDIFNMRNYHKWFKIPQNKIFN